MDATAVVARQGRQNNFNLLRFVAAMAVLLSHCFPLTYGEGAAEPLSNLLGMSLGHLALLVFFVISGFFISQSFVRSDGLVDFIAARILRIYPALVVVFLLTIFVVGPSTTNLTFNEYFSEASTFLYFVKGLTLKWLPVGLPGVFSENPYPVAVNGSLWTLFYEVACYAGAAVVIASAHKSIRRASLFFIAYVMIYGVIQWCDLRFGLFDRSPVIRNICDLSPAFVAGVIFFYCRDYIALRWSHSGVLAALCVLLYWTPIFGFALLVFVSYLVFLVGFRALPCLYGFNRVGDYSYGIYIYAFPVQQMMAQFSPGISAGAMFCAVAPIVLSLSIVSWHFIERPALESRRYFKTAVGAAPWGNTRRA